LKSQETDDSNDMMPCPAWGKGTVLEDLARKFYERLGKIVMCSQGRIFFETARELESEYTKEIEALKSKRTRTEAEQIRLEILRAREAFVHDIALCVTVERFFFSMETPEILHLAEEPMDPTEEWLSGTIFSEVGAAYACGLTRVIEASVPEGNDWKSVGEMNSLHKAAYYVYDAYYEAVEKAKGKENFTGGDIGEARMLNARCSLSKSFFFTVLREEVARKDPGSEGSTIGGDGGIYTCGCRDRVISRMKGEE